MQASLAFRGMAINSMSEAVSSLSIVWESWNETSSSKHLSAKQCGNAQHI